MTEARFMSRDTYYSDVIDKRHKAFYRDPVITPGDHGRADVPNGPMSKWLRFNQASQLVYVEDFRGRSRALTRTQYRIYSAIQRLAGTGVRVTMRSLGEFLGVAASTVYRAAVKLASMDLVAYQSNRGRNGGSVFLLRRAKDGLEWCQEAAMVIVRRWWRASEERISRLRRNVASYFPGREQDLYEHRYVPSRNRAQHFREWTVEDFREAGLM